MIVNAIGYKSNAYILVPRLGFYRDKSFKDNIVKTFPNYYLCKYDFDDSDMLKINIYNRDIYVFKLGYANDFVFKCEDDGLYYKCIDGTDSTYQDYFVVTSDAPTNLSLSNVLTNFDYTSSVTYCLNNNINVIDVNYNPITSIEDVIINKMYIRTDNNTWCCDKIQNRTVSKVDASNDMINVTYTIDLGDVTREIVENYAQPIDYYYKFTDPYGLNCDISVDYVFKDFILTARPSDPDNYSFDFYKAKLNGTMAEGTEDSIPYDYYKWTQDIDGKTYDSPLFTVECNKESIYVKFTVTCNPLLKSVDVKYYTEAYKNKKISGVFSGTKDYSIVSAYNDTTITFETTDGHKVIKTFTTSDIFKIEQYNDYVSSIIFITSTMLIENKCYITKNNSVPIHDNSFSITKMASNNKYVCGVLVTCLNYSTAAITNFCDVINNDNMQYTENNKLMYIIVDDIKVASFNNSLNYTWYSGDKQEDDNSDTLYYHKFLRYFPIGSYKDSSRNEKPARFGINDSSNTCKEHKKDKWYMIRCQDNISYLIQTFFEEVFSLPPSVIRYNSINSTWCKDEYYTFTYNKDYLADLTRFTGHEVIEHFVYA